MAPGLDGQDASKPAEEAAASEAGAVHDSLQRATSHEVSQVPVPALSLPGSWSSTGKSLKCHTMNML